MRLFGSLCNVIIGAVAGRDGRYMVYLAILRIYHSAILSADNTAPGGKSRINDGFMISQVNDLEAAS